MAVSYTNALSTDLLVTEIATLIEWRDDLLRRVFFSTQAATSYEPPVSVLISWCHKERERNAVDSKIVERLILVFNDLVRIGDDIAAQQGGVAVELYDGLNQQFSAYVDHVRRLHQDLADSAGAVDSLTGLRTVSGLKNELKREQDRFDRKGSAFSIASIEIDKLDQLQQDHDRRGMEAIYAHVAKVIAGAIRSFDDAYYLGGGEYLVILKHVEFMDACAAMDRLCAEVGNAQVALPSGARLDVTASFGIAEAQQREHPEGVIEHAKGARNQARAAGGNRVQEYHERSALERFARDFQRDQ